MAKMSFEEFMKAQEAYKAYIEEEEKAPEAKLEPEKAPEVEAEPEQPEQPAEDYKKELDEIRQQLALMAKALSPSLGDIQPVGIDDVVKKFFTE